ncbi:MAG: 3-methyl-2-oxobutanoate hydroxymethyltransferase [candidate division Zixibacteria bacterium]|nr:3-methyl-2-oxobutanoate hydroxymethyltransferase [candidate division Zixibacteria bacterium]
MSQRRIKITPPLLRQMKRKSEKIVFLTAYDYFTARALDRAGIEGILVGDTLNMVFYGRENTLSATMEQMIGHTDAVSRAVSRALVVGDMPFLSYQVSLPEAIANAGRFLKEGGAAAVKLEGGMEMASLIRRLVEVGIPVMGHIGLTPQSINKFGGHKVQGKTEASRNYLAESAEALEEAGCFAIVLEAVKNDIAAKITATLKIPTIGIGAGPATDGQIMVINDIMGMDEEFYAKFVRRYFNLGEKLREVASQFSNDVKRGDYPRDSESYG